MAFSTKIVSVSSPLTTGNQATTGVGFTPKAILFFASRQITTGSAADAGFMVGAATSTSARGAIATSSKNVVSGVSDTGRREDNALCIDIQDDSNNVLVGADLVTFDADGFTLNFTTVSASLDYNIYAVCLGGTDLTNAFLKQWNLATATGNQSITGVGFQPDCIIVFGQGSGTTLPTSGAVNFSTFGVGISSSARWTLGMRDNDGVSTTVSERMQRTAKLWALTSGSGGISSDGDLVSLDSDGFTVNITTGTTARGMFALCLKGGRYKVGSFNQATSTGNQAITGVGFQTRGLLLASFNNVTSSSVVSGLRESLGFGTSSTNRVCIWQGSANGLSNSALASQNNDTTNILKMMTESGVGAPTTQTVADLVSLDTDGFTINNTTADGTAREIVYLALGNLASSSPSASPSSSISSSPSSSQSPSSSVSSSPSSSPSPSSSISASPSSSISASPSRSISASPSSSASSSVSSSPSPSAGATGTNGNMSLLGV